MILNRKALDTILFISEDDNTQNTFSKKNSLFDIRYFNFENENLAAQHIPKMLKFSHCTFEAINPVDKTLLPLTKKEKLDICYQRGTRQFMVDWHRDGHQTNFECLSEKIITKPILVLEDGVDIAWDFVMKIEEALKELPFDWDILLISANMLSDNKDKNISYKRVTDNIYKVNEFSNCAGFLINGSKAAEKINNFIDKKFYSTPVPKFLSEKAKANKITVYCTKEMLVTKTDVFYSIPATLENYKSTLLVNSLSKYLYECTMN